MAAKRGGLGKGLDALFNENTVEGEGAVSVRLSDIEPNKNQPRKDFDAQSISELAESIEKHGLIQPIIVRPLTNGSYEIVAGERRWRACREAGLTSVPVIVKEISDRELSELALIENLQRENLNPVEEAFGYKNLIDTYMLTQEQVAESVGKSRVAVTNTLRLLNLEDKYLKALRENKITSGHARALLSVNGESRAQLFSLAVSGASVRELEKAAKQTKTAAPKQPRKSLKDTFFTEVELALKETLGRKVNIKPTVGERGTITVEFYNKEELTDFVKRLSED